MSGIGRARATRRLVGRRRRRARRGGTDHPGSIVTTPASPIARLGAIKELPVTIPVVVSAQQMRIVTLLRDPSQLNQPRERIKRVCVSQRSELWQPETP